MNQNQWAPAASVDDVIITEALHREPPPPPDYRAENAAMRRLALLMVHDPDAALQMLVELAIELCHAGSAGVSLLDREAGVFRWVATAGAYAPHKGGTTPAGFSPCGTCLARAAAQLYHWPGRVFTYLRAADPPIVRGLVVPLPAGQVDGTIWIVAHDEEQMFSTEDVRLMAGLGELAAAAIAARRGREQAEAERLAGLRASEQRFRRIVESNMIGMVFADAMTGAVHDANDAYLSIIGYTREELTAGKINWLALTPLEYAELERQVHERARVTGGAPPYQKEYVRRDGTRVPVMIGGALLDPRGTESVAYVLDLTDVKRAEAEARAARAEAERANHAKDQFLAVLSHELRTPLTPVVMTIAALEIEPGLPQGVREELAMIRRNIGLETRLIDDLLDVSRIMNGKMSLHLESARVHSLLSAAVDILWSDLLAKRQQLVWQLTAEFDQVHADPARLQQVFWNLIKNAIKFTPEGGTITICSRNPAPACIEVEVNDTGQGMDAEVLGRVFNAFDQGGHDVTTRTFGGLGLGLTISRAIVEMHDGQIAAHSDGKGSGSRFTVSLPTEGVVQAMVDRMTRGGVGVRAGRAPTGDRLPVRLLLVEDHLDTLRTMRRLLENMDFAVTAASTVSAAIRLMEAHAFDLVVSDIGLPDGTGLDLIRQARAAGHAMPAIALTGYGMESDIRSTHDAGFQAHLTKPIDISLLAATIRRLTVDHAIQSQG